MAGTRATRCSSWRVARSRSWSTRKAAASRRSSRASVPVASSASWRSSMVRARSATAVAVDRVETLVLRRDAFDRLIDEEPAISRALLAALAGEIRRLTDQIRGPPFPGPAGSARTTPAPAESCRRRPAGPVGEVRQPWPYTQGELAGMIGGSRQSVNRLLADFVAQGLLRFEGDYLVIPDSRRLAEAVNRRATTRRDRARSSASWRLMRSSRWRPGWQRPTGSRRPPASRRFTRSPRRRPTSSVSRRRPSPCMTPPPIDSSFALPPAAGTWRHRVEHRSARGHRRLRLLDRAAHRGRRRRRRPTIRAHDGRTDRVRARAPCWRCRSSTGSR